MMRRFPVFFLAQLARRATLASRLHHTDDLNDAIVRDRIVQIGLLLGRKETRH